MSDLTSLITHFYTSLPNKGFQNLIKGQIAWVPYSYIDKITRIMDVQRAVSNDHENVRFDIRQINNNDFKFKASRLPIHNITLNETEELVVAKAKRRPCIFISKTHLDHTTEEIKILTNGKSHQLDTIYIFVPLYSIQAEGSDGGFGSDLSLRIKKLKYDHLLYLDKSSVQGTNLTQAIARIDRVFGIYGHQNNIEPDSLGLSDDIKPFFFYMMESYLFDRTIPELEEYRNLF